MQMQEQSSTEGKKLSDELREKTFAFHEKRLKETLQLIRTKAFEAAEERGATHVDLSNLNIEADANNGFEPILRKAIKKEGLHISTEYFSEKGRKYYKLMSVSWR